MRDFSVTGIPTVDYYDLFEETESRILFGSTAIYAAAALAKQSADILFSGPIGTDLDHNLLTPLRDYGVKFDLHEMDGSQAWLKMAFADGGKVTSIKIDMGVGTAFEAAQLSDDFWQARVCWIGTCPHEYTVAVAKKGRASGCEVVLSPQGRFGYSPEDIVELIEQLSFLNCNTAEMSTLGGGKLETGLEMLREINPDLQILLTRGRNGAWFIGRNTVYSIPAIPQIESEFLIGAGDTFAATFHYYRIQGEPIPTCLQRATVAAVLKIRGFSYSQMAARDELLAKVDELAPQLPVEQASLNSEMVKGWFSAEIPDTTQDGSVEVKE